MFSSFVIDSPSVSFRVDDDVKEDEMTNQIINGKETKGAQEDDNGRQRDMGKV